MVAWLSSARLSPPPAPPPRPVADGGFLLPLASTGALLLLLSSLSLQAMALQERSSLAAQQRRRLREDRLMSAAQLLVGRLQRRHRCLLTRPVQTWPEASCLAGGDLAELHSATAAVGDGPYRLVQYCPEPAVPAAAELPRALLVLELEQPAPARRAAFHVLLAPGQDPLEPARVAGLRERGLLAAVPQPVPPLPQPCPEMVP